MFFFGFLLIFRSFSMVDNHLSGAWEMYFLVFFLFCFLLHLHLIAVQKKIDEVKGSECRLRELLKDVHGNLHWFFVSIFHLCSLNMEVHVSGIFFLVQIHYRQIHIRNLCSKFSRYIVWRITNWFVATMTIRKVVWKRHANQVMPKILYDMQFF